MFLGQRAFWDSLIPRNSPHLETIRFVQSQGNHFLMKSPALSEWTEPVSLNAGLIHTFTQNYFYHFTFALDQYLSREQSHKASFSRTACVTGNS